MDKIDINEIIKAAAGSLDLSNFKGDVVMYKHVEKEMNVAEGGIGEQHIHHHYAKEQDNADASTGAIADAPSTSYDAVTNCDAIPADCTEAVKKVVVPTFTIEGGVVLNSATQIAKAAKQIDLSSNSQVAMLMAIGMEVNAVRPGCSCPDFVRALIGMRVIAYTDSKAIDTMAGGISKKLYGYKKGDKEYPPLSSNHQRWNTNDQPIGKRLFETMRTQA